MLHMQPDAEIELKQRKLLSDLRALQTAKDEGLLSIEEFTQQRKLLLSNPDDELDGGDFECPDDVVIHDEYPEDEESSIMNGFIFHGWDVGWSECKVCRRVALSMTPT